MPAFIKLHPMTTTYTAIVVLSSLSLLLALLARQFDKHLYTPFLQRIGIEPASQPEFNPHLFRIGIYVAGYGILFYAVIGWVWVSIV